MLCREASDGRAGGLNAYAEARNGLACRPQSAFILRWPDQHLGVVDAADQKFDTRGLEASEARGSGTMVGVRAVERRDHNIGVEDADVQPDALAPLFGAKALQIIRLEEAVENSEGGRQVNRGTVNDDAVRPFGLHHDLVSGPQPSGLQRLNRQSHLML